MATTRHKLMDGRVQVYSRPNTPYWWCCASISGKQRRASTGEVDLSLAKVSARNWYLRELGAYVAKDVPGGVAAREAQLDGIGKFLSGDFDQINTRRRKDGVTFRHAADQFLKEVEALTEGERNPKYVYYKEMYLNVHLLPYLGDKLVTEITPGVVQDYRVHRMTSRVNAKGEAKRPARSTIHQEIVTLRQVLKTASRHGWLPYLPDLSTPYKASGKIGHRAWFSPDEWKQFYEHTRKRAKFPPKERWRKECEDFHDICLIMVNTGLRPDEAKRIEFRDVAIVTDEATGERILEIAVRGKRGTGWCKSMPGAVLPYKRLCERNNYGPKDLVFAKRMRELMNAVLDELDLKKDREGNPRTTYSFRHTYISMRLSEGADIYQVAKNCRTSVEMIEKHYAIHIKNMIDARAINVRRPKNTGKRKLPRRSNKHKGEAAPRDPR